ncbi:MAG: tetratricopeptide repeat protein [Myxococcota bacterium]
MLLLRGDLVVPRLRVANYKLRAGDAQAALKDLQIAIKFEPENVPAHLSLSDAYRLIGQYALAKNELDWVEKREPSSPQIHYNRGLLYLLAPSIQGFTELQKVNAAIKSFEKYKELRPKGERSDVDELVKQATFKKAELEALQKAKTPPPAAPPPPAPKG